MSQIKRALISGGARLELPLRLVFFNGRSALDPKLRLLLKYIRTNRLLFTGGWPPQYAKYEGICIINLRKNQISKAMLRIAARIRHYRFNLDFGERVVVFVRGFGRRG